jgi:hypothetical protein
VDGESSQKSEAAEIQNAENEGCVAQRVAFLDAVVVQ